MPYRAYDEEITGNFILDHWYGRYTLPRSYWINFILLSGLVTGFVLVIIDSSVDNLTSLQVSSSLAIFGVLFSIGAWVWGAVGVWRSASSHTERGGNGGWATIAKFVVVLGAFATVGQISKSLETLTETAGLAVNNDSLGQPAKLSISGKTLKIDGPITLGTAAELTETLAQLPDIKTISISSVGGRIAEAVQIGAEIKKRNLNTIVSGHCESACTVVLLAGAQRIASFGSSVGFHQPTYPGLEPQEEAELINDLRAVYLEAGLPRSFVNKALESSPEDMWYPQETELFEAGVYNSFDQRRVLEDNLASAEQINRDSPVQIDEITALVSAKANREVLTFKYRVSTPAEEFDLRIAEASLYQASKNEICEKPLLPRLFAAGGVYRFIYLDPDGKTIADFQVDQC